MRKKERTNSPIANVFLCLMRGFGGWGLDRAEIVCSSSEIGGDARVKRCWLSLEGRHHLGKDKLLRCCLRLEKAAQTVEVG